MPLPTPAVTDFGSFAGLRASARANDPEAVKKAAQQFEALFTQQLLKSARAAKLGEDLLGGGQAEFYQDLFDQQMAMHLSSGKGLGLADVLVKQLQGLGAPASAPETPDTARPLPGPVQLPVAAARAEIPLRAAQNPPTSAEQFVDQIRPHAERAARELGVPPEAIMAQAALETGWGKHVPAQADGRSSHNYFGIKATPNWQGGRVEKTTHEHLGGRMQKVSAEFRAYESPAQAFEDYVNFLKTNPRYTEALQNGSETGRFAQGLQAAGYATDPDYATKLLKVANSRPMNSSPSQAF